MGKRIAFLVGINDYGHESGLSKLDYAEADVELMADTLKNSAGFMVKPLKGNQATYGGIDEGLREFNQQDDVDLFIFYFSGHGELTRGAGMHCLHCYGSKATDTFGTIKIHELADRINSTIPARIILLIIDACRNKVYRDANIKGNLVLNSSAQVEFKEISNTPRQIAPRKDKNSESQLFYTLLSCGVDQVSFEDSDLKHGIFTYILAEEIKENGAQVTLTDLGIRVGNLTDIICRKRGLMPIQKPELIQPANSRKVFLVEPLATVLPDEDKILGKALSETLDAPPSPYGTQGYLRRYEKGSIYMIRKMGNPGREFPKKMGNSTFRVVDSNIAARYKSLGESRSILGFPVGDKIEAWGSERGKKKSPGKVQSFEGGTIYFCDGLGAHSLAGNIKNAVMQSEEYILKSKKKQLTGGEFGFPTSEPMEVSSVTQARAVEQWFEYGLIVDWSAGTYGIVKGFYNIYQSMDGMNRSFGFPLGDEILTASPISGKEAMIQYFEEGCMIWPVNADRGIVITGEIYTQWKDNKNKYGFPLHNSYLIKDIWVQHFEGGKLNEKQNAESFERTSIIEVKPTEKLTKIPSTIFDSPFILSQDRFEALGFIHEKLADNLMSLLRFLINTQIEVEVQTSREWNYSQFLNQLPEFTYITLISMGFLTEPAAIEIDPAILSAIKNISNQRYNEADLQTVNDKIVDEIIQALKETWEEFASLKLNISPLQKETSPQPLRRLNFQGNVTVIHFQLTAGETRGMIRYCIPNSFLKEVADHLDLIIVTP